MIPWTLLLSLAMPAHAAGACLPLSGELVLARDVARAVPAFAAVAPELVLGSVPAAGVRRVYDAAELGRLARRYGVALDPGVETCFVRPVETLTRARVTEALRLALPAAALEVVAFSRQPIPRGALRFPAAGMQADAPSNAPLLWRGVVCASGQDDFPVWAKVRVRISGMRVTAAEALAPGHPIGRAQLREEPYEGPPGFPGLSEIVGRAPRLPIPAGAVIERRWLDEPADVFRGDRVSVEIRCGRARVMLAGEAQSGGKRGETVAVRNPANGKLLHAVVAGRGRVILAADPAESVYR